MDMGEREELWVCKGIPFFNQTATDFFSNLLVVFYKIAGTSPLIFFLLFSFR